MSFRDVKVLCCESVVGFYDTNRVSRSISYGFEKTSFRENEVFQKNTDFSECIPIEINLLMGLMVKMNLSGLIF